MDISSVKDNDISWEGKNRSPLKAHSYRLREANTRILESN